MDVKRLPLCVTAICGILFLIIFLILEWMNDHTIITAIISEDFPINDLPTKEDVVAKASNIYFLRVPKTGSTTLYNIFSRFAWKNNLRFATYKRHPITNEFNSAMKEELWPPFVEGESTKYNVFTEHTRYVPGDVETILHQPTVHISMVRSPVPWLDSTLHFLGLIDYFGLNKSNAASSFVEKLDDPSWTDLHKSDLKEIANWTSRMFMARTRPSDYNVDVLKDLSATFLVGIHEYFDESLVLLGGSLAGLSRILCTLLFWFKTIRSEK